MKTASSPTRWIQSTFVSLIGIAIVICIGISTALAAPTAQASQELLDAQPQPIEPELTNPDEVPIGESQAPPQISAIDWFEELAVTADVVEPEGNSLDSLLDQWLSTAKTIFDGK